MSGIRKRYCVFGCDALVTQGVPFHQFPHPEKCPALFTAWVTAVGDKLKVTDCKKIYKNKRICDHHFDPTYKISGARLMQSAIPSVNLNRIQQSVVTYVKADHNYSSAKRESLQSRPFMHVTVLPDPSISAADSTAFQIPSGSTASTCLTVPDEVHARTSHTKYDAGLSDHTYTKEKKHNDHSYIKVGDNLTSGTKYNVPGADKKDGGIVSYEVPVVDDTPEDAAEAAPDNAPKDPDPSDPDASESIKAVFSWETKSIIAADDTVVPESRQEASVPTVLARDFTEISLYQDLDPCVSEDISGNDHSYVCDECGGLIAGFRYACVQCVDWDLCGACEARAAHAAHYLLRIPSPRPYKQIQAVLATIRQQLLSENHFEPERAPSVKSEPEEPRGLREAQEGDPLGDWDVEFPDSSDIDEAPGVLEDAPRARTPRAPAPGRDTRLTPGPELILNRLPIRQHAIKKRKIVDESEVSQEAIRQCGDTLTPPRTGPAETTAGIPASPTIPTIENARNILVRIPTGFDPVEAVKMLNPQVSVRLKPIEERIARVVSKKTEN